MGSVNEIDAPLDAEEAAATMAFAEVEAGATRLAILRDSIGAEEVAALTGLSRQAIERLRREGRLLALRVGSQWRYPRWQLGPDSPGGIVPALDTVLGHLALSPIGAAIWLMTPREELVGATPIELLRHRQSERVVQLAFEQGFMP
ncbi:MAG: helix-turn-helix domain-containing protein [Thermoanaerobaculia bacterium]|nr:helix-turn-helix domain-containing protein [Thermoanaerobaculia bacterium]